MSGRCPRLSAASLPLVLFVLLAIGGRAQAHRLEADYQVLSARRIQIESWFDVTGASARGAKVRVYDADNVLVAEGELDDNGTLVFSVPASGPFRVLIAVPGHTRELVIPKGALEQAVVGANAPGPFADRSPRVTYAEIITGVAFVLALASFVLGVRNARRLQHMEENVKAKSSEHRS